MPVTITNLQTTGPLHVPLASGRTLRLSPRESSEPIPEVEVEENASVDRLVGNGVVEVAAHGGGARAAGGRPARKATAKRSAAKRATAKPSDGSPPASDQ